MAHGRPKPRSASRRRNHARCVQRNADASQCTRPREMGGQNLRRARWRGVNAASGLIDHPQIRQGLPNEAQCPCAARAAIDERLGSADASRRDPDSQRVEEDLGLSGLRRRRARQGNRGPGRAASWRRCRPRRLSTASNAEAHQASGGSIDEINAPRQPRQVRRWSRDGKPPVRRIEQASRELAFRPTSRDGRGSRSARSGVGLPRPRPTKRSERRYLTS